MKTHHENLGQRIASKSTQKQSKMQSLWNEFTKEPKPQQITTGHEGDE